eukprot:356534-Chlamydomonas_euryale.AAC.1
MALHRRGGVQRVYCSVHQVRRPLLAAEQQGTCDCAAPPLHAATPANPCFHITDCFGLISVPDALSRPAPQPHTHHSPDLPSLASHHQVGYTTSIKYQAPGEELNPNELVSITGDDDLAVGVVVVGASLMRAGLRGGGCDGEGGAVSTMVLIAIPALVWLVHGLVNGRL